MLKSNLMEKRGQYAVAASQLIILAISTSLSPIFQVLTWQGLTP
jgi:hypothetical protein